MKQLLKNAKLYDGTGAQPIIGDVLIDGDRIANLEYSIAVFRFKENERALKLSFLINTALYAFFGFAIKNYVGVAANLVVIVTTAVTLLSESRRHKG